MTATTSALDRDQFFALEQVIRGYVFSSTIFICINITTYTNTLTFFYFIPYYLEQRECFAVLINAFFFVTLEGYCMHGLG